MPSQKPTLLQVTAWMTLVSGVVNLFWGFAASGTALATIIGVVCVPLTILPAVLGVFELIYAAKLFSEPPQILQPSTNIAVFEIASMLTGNLFSTAVGILALVFYNDQAVRDYFARLNGTLAPQPEPQPAPASLPDLEPAPAQETSPTPEADSPTPPAEEPPAKPKRGPRKAA
ncbi:MAG: hypothetical protein Kow0070_12300 [Anaerolineales bacterium]